MAIHLGNSVRKKEKWVYNPRMKRWVKRKRKGQGFFISSYHKKPK